MEQFITRIRTNLNGVLEMTQMFEGLMMTGDNLANRIIVSLNRDGVPIDIPGDASIIGYVIRNDGYTLDIPGSTLTEGGQVCAYIDIPSFAYLVSGPLSVAIRMLQGEQKVVIATASCYVNLTETGAIIDTSHRIPDVEELLSHIADIDAEREAIAQAEAARVIAESGRVSAESSRVTAESRRATAESSRVTAESRRVTAESSRATAESGRVSAESSRVTAESARATAESSRVTAQNARNAKIDNMEVAVTKLATYADPTVNIIETGSDNHKKITFGIAPGDPFVIQKTFKTVSAMNSYTGTDLRAGQFVLITSDNGAEDVDNAKMYVVKTAKPVSSSNTFTFVTDLSGAQGIKGNGIANASLNTSDYKLTLNWTEGGSYTTPISIRGATGATGNGISSASLDSSTYKLTLNYTNGTSYTTPISIRGATGNGISSASLDSSTYKLTLNYTDGTSYTTPISIRGATGATGNGISNAEVTSDNKLKFTYTNGTSYTTPISIKGEKGEPGEGAAVFTYDSTEQKLAVTFGSN